MLSWEGAGLLAASSRSPQTGAAEAFHTWFKTDTIPPPRRRNLYVSFKLSYRPTANDDLFGSVVSSFIRRVNAPSAPAIPRPRQTVTLEPARQAVLDDYFASRSIQAGEELGYEDSFVPTLGESGIPTLVPWLQATKSAKPQDADVPTIAVGPLVDTDDTPEFPAGSIFAPGEIWGTDLPTEVYDAPYEVIDPDLPVPEYVEDAATQKPTDDGVDTMATDWGELIFNTASNYLTGLTTNQFSAPGYPTTPATQPRTVTVDTITGKVTACKRRRRRRLLTEGDFNDLMRIATLPNKQNVTVALAKAVGRR